VHIIYFSQTDGAVRAASGFEKIFIKKEIEVVKVRLDTQKARNLQLHSISIEVPVLNRVALCLFTSFLKKALFFTLFVHIEK
jgi:hypothetical protein